MCSSTLDAAVLLLSHFCVYRVSTCANMLRNSLELGSIERTQSVRPLHIYFPTATQKHICFYCEWCIHTVDITGRLFPPLFKAINSQKKRTKRKTDEQANCYLPIIITGIVSLDVDCFSFVALTLRQHV